MRDDARLGARNAYYSSDLIVALEHVNEVARTLERLGVAFGEVDRSESLGLALLPLRDDRAAADVVQAAVAEDSDRSSGAVPPGTGTDMDRLLHGLRTHFAGRFAGWTPTIGKNRLVGQVIGVRRKKGEKGKVSHGGGPDPEATTRRRPPRPAQPGRGVRVGVLDTPISAHSWLAGGWVGPSEDVLHGDGHRAVAGHATFVAGLVLSQAPGCVVEARQVLSDEDGESDSWTVAKEIVELGRTGLDVLNLSFVCYTEDGQPPLTLAAAIERLDPDTVVVAAAGNHGDLDPEPVKGDRRKPAWPAALDHVVAVGAADREGTPTAFTPAGVPWIDVLAPGVDLVSTFLSGPVEVGGAGGTSQLLTFDGYATWSGTSFAAALVSGAIAARTVPGRTSARDAWKGLSTRATNTGPRFLPLDVQP
jgi:membrane-anchored mycosin MYCP